MKLFRTYICGSKKNELIVFSEFYTTNEINWVKYLNLFNTFSDDIIIVLLSRLKLLTYLTHISFILTILIVILFSVTTFYIIIPFILLYVEYKQKTKLRKVELLNEFTKNIIKKEINSQYNF